MITVSVPERADRPRDPIYMSHAARINPGRVEIYLVSLSEDELEKAGGVPATTAPAGDPEPVALSFERLKAESRRTVDIRRAHLEARRLQVEEARATITSFETEFKPVLERALGSVTEVQAASDTFIRRGASVLEGNRKVLAADLPNVINNPAARPPVRTRIALTEAQLSELKTRLDANGVVTASVLAEILGRRPASGASLLREDPTKIICRELRGGRGRDRRAGRPLVTGDPRQPSCDRHRLRPDAIELAEDAIDAVGDFIHPDMPEVGTSREEVLKETIQRTIDDERDLLMRLEREVTALNALTETYAKALAENFNQRMQILRLRTHIKQNIFYCMQAIWSHEPPDQGFLRLHETPVPTFGGERRYRFTSLEPVPGAMTNMAHRRFGGLSVRWVFDSRQLSRSFVYEHLRQAIRRDPVLAEELGAGAKLDAALDKLVIMYAPPVPVGPPLPGLHGVVKAQQDDA